MKQTAVEWLEEQLSVVSRPDLFEQAKAMEKEQIIEAWMVIDNELQRIGAEKYYNETFKSE